MNNKNGISIGMKIDGREISANILNELKPQVEELKQKGIIPTLAIILIGNNQSSQSYIKQKQIKVAEIGAQIKLFHFESTSQEELINLINKLNDDPLIQGIIVQRPLPDGISTELISQTVSSGKDVDGFNKESSFDAPVAEAVIEILNSIGEKDLSNKNIIVIGKGETAGRPIINLLDKMELNFKIVDRTTQNPEEEIMSADIIISAVGKENTIKPQNLNSNQILIGVGLFLRDGRLKGDYEETEVENKVKFYTPTIGGVGPVNVACLMKNLIRASSGSRIMN